MLDTLKFSAKELILKTLLVRVRLFIVAMYVRELELINIHRTL